MIYRFHHPEDPHIVFLYNDQVPTVITRLAAGQSQHLPLTFKNVNTENFFHALIKAKSVHIEDREVGSASIDGRKIRVTRPYDCKWAVHQILGVTDKYPVIVNDRQERCYVWLLTDEQMLVPDDYLETALAQAGGEEKNDFATQIAQKREAFKQKNREWETGFQERREQAFGAFSESQAQNREWFDSELPGDAFAEFENDWQSRQQQLKQDRTRQLAEKEEGTDE